ncbi:YbjN domain-containing protein [Paracoccus methylovorus]|uniref:YbjN domain-containing protein n=2 Tax=Paracoccus TaxID=265 RepID=A0ABX7JJQ3_9RHOB|nr:YbjN domain-containing protein [Paracoccus methylovorus]QRZ13149.1 YbjN domain-containing protein [Paracoccus methylovorus]
MRTLAPLVLAVLLQAPAAQAQVLGDPEVIRLMMMDFGVPAKLSTDGADDPMIESRIDGTSFQVYFYNCEKACGAIQFSAGFDLHDGMTETMANRWNRENRFGKVWLDETSDPFIEMDIGVAGDGIGRKNFDDALDTWRIVLSDFRQYIDW